VGEIWRRLCDPAGGSHRRKKSICFIPLPKASVATGIFIRFPYVQRPEQNICLDIAEFVLVLVLAASALAGTMIMLSYSIG
jgi:hypothetical protein